MPSTSGWHGTNHRQRRIQEVYAEMVAQLPPGPRPTEVLGVIPDLFAAATAQVDQELDIQAAILSQIILDSELADDALALVAGVERGTGDTERAIRVTDLSTRYAEHRKALLIALITSSGMSVCRKCKQLSPADEVKLVLIDECYLKPQDKGHVSVVETYFGYLCAECRAEKPIVTEDIVQPDGTQATAATYRLEYDAAEAGGLFWVLIEGEFQVSLGDSGIQPDTKLTGPIVLTDALAEQFDLPPVITVHGTLGEDARVVIQVKGVNLPFAIPATVTQ